MFISCKTFLLDRMWTARLLVHGQLEVAVQALASSPLAAQRKLQIGEKLTRGLGAGGNPAIGQAGDQQGCRVLGAGKTFLGEARPGCSKQCSWANRGAAAAVKGVAGGPHHPRVDRSLPTCPRAG